MSALLLTMTQRTMRCAAVLLTVLLSGFVLGQQFPRAEVFGGYQFTAIDGSLFQANINALAQAGSAPPSSLGGHGRANGWNGSGGVNLDNWLGVLFDFSGAYSKQSITLASTPAPLTAQSSARLYTLMAGPQLIYRGSLRWQPFARALVGGVVARLSGNLISNGGNVLARDIHTDETGIGYGGGGGVDIHVSHKIYLRLAGDYIRSGVFGLTQNNFRASTGLVFKQERVVPAPTPKRAPAVAPPVQEIGMPTLGLFGVNEANRGVRITRIAPGGPSSQSTLQAGDIIVQINGKLTLRAEDVIAALRAYPPGSKITVSYMRGYWQSETTVTLK